TARLGINWRDTLAAFAGFCPWIGTSWFVTAILELVVVFPVLRWIFHRLGALVTLAASLAICFACSYYVFDILDWGRFYLGGKVPDPGWYYQWIFAPRLFWMVLAGVLVAAWWKGRLPRPLTAVAVALTLCRSLVFRAVHGPPEDFFFGALREQG